MSVLLAVIRSAAGTPAATPASLPAATPLRLEMRPIAAPLDIFPLLPWQSALLAAAASVLLFLLVPWLWRTARRLLARPAAPPLTPRQAALAALEQLRAQVRTLSPYEFSIAVSEVLRTFVEGQYGLRARKQTSPEFLASLGPGSPFAEEERRLLADFLTQCDLLKFARAEAGPETSEALLGSATAFVQGGRA